MGKLTFDKKISEDIFNYLFQPSLTYTLLTILLQPAFYVSIPTLHDENFHVQTSQPAPSAHEVEHP